MMALINWTPSLSVGIEEIDMQHQGLIKYISDLNDAMSQGQSNEAIVLIVKGLVEETETHFGYEETLFARYNFPDAASHKKKHAHYVNKIKEFQVQCEGGQIGVPTQVMNFLSDWLMSHIQGTDSQYVPFFKEKGVVFDALTV